MKKLTQGQVRRLIEAEVDKMREPNGPNSRDDGDNDLTEDDLTEHLREEYDPTASFLEDVGDQIKAVLDVLDREVQGSSDAFEAMDRLHKLMIQIKRQAITNRQGATAKWKDLRNS